MSFMLADLAADALALEGRYRRAIADAIADGRLPAIDVTVTGSGDGLFATVAVVVTDSPVPLVVRTTSGARTLTDAGERVQRLLLALGDTITLPDRWVHRTVDITAEAAPAAVSQMPAAGGAAGGMARLVDLIAERLGAGAALDWKALFALADEAFGGSLAAGAWSAKDAYEASEAAVNRLILAEPARFAPTGDRTHAAAVGAELAALLGRLPTHTRRDTETVRLQQFSTPQPYAHACAWAADLRAGEHMVEPSAGTGSLCVFATAAGASVTVNEISPRRSALLRGLGYAPLAEDGGQLHNILAGKITPPTVILMNPPYSRSIQKGDRADPATAARHVNAALTLLAPGGRLVAVLPNRLGVATSPWLADVGKRFAVRANVLVSGALFAAHGTGVETRVLVIDKAAPVDALPVVGAARTLDELYAVLEAVRGTRPSIAAPVPANDAAAGPAVATVADMGLGSAETTAATLGEDSRYAPYEVRTVQLPGARPHPTPLVESLAMAAVAPPAAWYRPALPSDVVTSGKLSLAQYETVVMAGQAFQQSLRQTTDGIPWRLGYFLGDAGGVGKGRQVAGVILDSFAQGQTRAVWLTKDAGLLLQAARRDWQALGGDPKDVFTLNRYRPNEPVPVKRGIMLVSYGTLRSGSGRNGGRRRVDQIIEWCGKDFAGVLAFDESHKMSEALTGNSEFGKTKGSLTGMTGVELQERLPTARVLYTSATGADKPKNLSYCTRLGLWGPGTPFVDAVDFVASLEESGIAGMEVVARDLKALGRYTSRSLSFAGVKYERVVHTLSPEQEAIYDRLSAAWRLVLSHFEDAMEKTEAAKSPLARGAAKSAFWSALQRFFNQVLMSFQMPTVIASIKRDLEAGHAAVAQLVNTLEAALNRQLAQEGAMENLEDLDLTPRDVLIELVRQSFPVAQFQTVVGLDGKESVVPVTNSKGEPVLSAEAVKMRDDLLMELGAIQVPQGPLDMLLDTLGPDQVAELTGRSRRVVVRPGPDGTPTRTVENRTEAQRLAELQAFHDDKKRTIVFSNAANTGLDMHAGRGFTNRRLRRHYVIQAGWQAKEAAQAMYRTHRSDQEQPPEYVLVSTNIKAQLRFISTICQRLGALGALTRGQKDTGNAGIFSEADDLENQYGQDALYQMVVDLFNGGDVAGFTLTDLEDALALRLRDDTGGLLKAKIPPVKLFLNRLLACPIKVQNTLFADFADRMQDNIEAAKKAGTLNRGMEDYSADRIEVIAAPRTVYTDAATGAATQYVHLRAWHRRSGRRFDSVARGWVDGCERRIVGFVADGAGKARAVAAARSRTKENGDVVGQYRMVGPFSEEFADRPSVDATYDWIDEATAAHLWAAECATADEWWIDELHLLTGLILPLWDRIGGSGRVVRVKPSDSQSYLGRLMHPGKVRSTLARLGAAVDAQWSPAEVIDAAIAGDTVTLANGWRIGRLRLAGTWRVELTGWPVTKLRALEQLGLVVEMHNFRTRVFIPTGKPDVLAALLAEHPVCDGDSAVPKAA
ncbi:strawberry notch-like NTP hydrolase domain-containing protein [Azospirillum sp. sgz302134]